MGAGALQLVCRLGKVVQVGAAAARKDAHVAHMATFGRLGKNRCCFPSVPML